MLFVFSYTAFDNIQDWFWSDNGYNRAWWIEVTAIWLGMCQYYWLFLVGCWLVLGLTFGILYFFIPQ